MVIYSPDQSTRRPSPVDRWHGSETHRVTDDEQFHEELDECTLFTANSLDARLQKKGLLPTGVSCLGMGKEVFARQYKMSNKSDELAWCVLKRIHQTGDAEDQSSMKFAYEVKDSSGTILYRFPFQLPPEKQVEFEMEIDRANKTVTARGFWSYVAELRLEPEVIFGPPPSPLRREPPHVLVVGDPYKKMVGENRTLIDYEFTDEIFPDLLRWFKEIEQLCSADDRTEEQARAEIKRRFDYFWSVLHEGDNMALHMRYSDEQKSLSGRSWWSRYTDPAFLFKDKVTDAIGNLFAELYFAQSDPLKQQNFEQALARFKQRIQIFSRLENELLTGTWQVNDYTADVVDVTEEMLFGKSAPTTPSEDAKQLGPIYPASDYDDGSEKAVWDVFNPTMANSDFVSPEDSGDDLGLRWLKAHHEFDHSAENETLKMELLRAIGIVETVFNQLSGIETGFLGEHIAAVKKDVAALTQASALDHIKNLANATVRLYSDVLSLAVSSGKAVSITDEDQTALRLLSESDIGDYSMPGLNGRVRTYLRELTNFCRRVVTYFESIWVHRQKEMDRLHADKIPLDPEIKELYLNALEKPLRQEYLHSSDVQQGVSLHGFFPTSVPIAPESQDRIVALYSLSTHLWDSFKTPQDYEDHLRKAIEYLKPDGKLVVGPINWRQIRAIKANDYSWHNVTGNAPLLLTALQKLAAEGLIDFQFNLQDMEQLSNHSQVVYRLHSQEESAIVMAEEGKHFSSSALVITKTNIAYS